MASTWMAPSIVGLDRVAAAVGSSTCDTPVVADGAELIVPPASITSGALESDVYSRVWSEVGPLTLPNDLRVNRITPGTFECDTDEMETIAAGTEVCSYFVHTDLVSTSGTLTGSMTFPSATIIGLIYKRDEFNASSILEAPQTDYRYAPSERRDVVTLAGSFVEWSLNVGTGRDHIRVITTCP